MCAYYMSMGMTYEEYWFGSNDMLRHYRSAYLLKCQAENQKMWLQGLYMQQAIASCLDKKAKYPQEPIDCIPKTSEQIKMEEASKREKIIKALNNIALIYGDKK